MSNKPPVANLLLTWLTTYRPEITALIDEDFLTGERKFGLRALMAEIRNAQRDLNGPQTNDKVEGDAKGNTLYGGGGNDDLFGHDGNDRLNGGSGDDVLEGGAGADRLIGGQGRDGASYSESEAAVRIDLTTGVHTGDAKGDTFSSIEFFRLSDLDDTFVGTDDGDEDIRGGGGRDNLSGKDGRDWLRGEAGNDVLDGGLGDDVLEGGAGADVLRGGDGVDTASYATAVAINLASGTHQGDAAGDTFTSIEHFNLSKFGDSFLGGSGDDWVAGYAGADALGGGDGKDLLNGGDGDDILDGGAGTDRLIGEKGNDILTGGGGFDQFKITAPGFGNDLITDFEFGQDTVRITGYSLADSFDDLVVSANGSGWAVVTFPDGSTLTFESMDVADVDADMFVWG